MGKQIKMKTNTCMSNIIKVNILKEELKSSEVISEFNESLNLVSSQIINIFSKRPLTNLFSKCLKIEKNTDLIKKKIISNCMNINYAKVFKILNNLTKIEFEKIGSEFFYITAIKFAKNQSINNFSKFLNIMFKNFGFDPQFIKKFFYSNRDYYECLSLIDYVKKWNNNNFENKLVILFHLSNNAVFDDFVNFYYEIENYIIFENDEIRNDIYEKLLLNIIMSNFYKKNDIDFLKETLSFFKDIGYIYETLICNKIFEIINKYINDDEYVNILLEFMNNNNIEKNSITYNTILDYNCMNKSFEEVYKKYEEMKNLNIKPDNFTYSIMIKSIKKMEKPDLDLAENFFNNYIKEYNTKDIIIYNSILDLFITCKEIEKANNIYNIIKAEELLKPDQITFNIL